MYLAMPRPVSTTRPAMIFALVPAVISRACSMKRWKLSISYTAWVWKKSAPASTLRRELVHLRLERVGLGRDDGADEEVGRAIQLVARPVGAGIHLLAALDQMDRVEIEHALGLLVIAHHRVVAGEAEDVGDAQERGRQQVGLQAQAVAVAAGGLEDGVAAAAHDLAGHRQGAQAHDRALVVGDVQAVDTCPSAGRCRAACARHWCPSAGRSRRRRRSYRCCRRRGRCPLHLAPHLRLCRNPARRLRRDAG